MSASAMLRLSGVDHVGLVVADMDATLRFYQRLGLTVLRTSGPNADGVRSAVIQVGEQELNVFADPRVGAPAAGRTTGLDHFCVLVDADSIEDVVAALRHAGIEIDRGPIARRAGTALFIRDPDGVRVELQLKKPAAT